MTQLIEVIDMLDGAGLIIENLDEIKVELARMGFDPQTEVDPIENDDWDDDWDDGEDMIDSSRLFGDDELDYKG